MQKFSFKQKMYLQIICISLLLSSIAGFISFRNSQNSKLFLNISQNNLPKIERLGTLLALFRDIRIQVRSIGLSGNTAKDYERYKKETIRAIDAFLLEKEKIAKMNLNEDEKKLLDKLNLSWNDFQEFGKHLLELLDKGDADSLAKLNDLVRNVCQVKADVFFKDLQQLIEYQKTTSTELVGQATDNQLATERLALVSVIIGLVVALLVGGMFANKMSRSLELNIAVLKEGSHEIETYSDNISKVSSSLSEATVQQSSSLQETVSSIDEISAMIARNADNAESSARTAELSLDTARQGKVKVEQMVKSINLIAQSNTDIVSQMQQTNKEISEIVTVIRDIATKTQVINDIVFQTKLLSFNASVEAARAGENGKGFAVVAEEVGNLASMSGNAAGEISALLKSSTERVEDVVGRTQVLMERVISDSKSKVEAGISTAGDCAKSLDEIYQNVMNMTRMVKEISVASSEQSTGVKEINRSMNELDRVTQTNSAIARETSDAATVLKDQAEKLNQLVASLTAIVGGGEPVSNLSRFPESKEKHFSEAS